MTKSRAPWSHGGHGDVRHPNLGPLTISICQHGLLWLSLFVASSGIYLMIIHAVSLDALPAVYLSLLAAALTTTYLLLHNIAAIILRRGLRKPRFSPAEWTSKAALRLSVAVWMLTCGFDMTFIAAKQPRCLWDASEMPIASTLDVGTTCIVQRTNTAVSFAILVMTIVLCVVLTKTQEPFRGSLFGISKEHSGLPASVASRQWQQQTPSEMSFKCRSSASLCTKSALPSYSQPPTQQKTPVGLGIFTDKLADRSLLAPRPSLFLVQSYTKHHSSPPPATPLPPLPAYIPDKPRRANSMDSAVRQHMTKHVPLQGQPTIRIVPPVATLSGTNLCLRSPSSDSLSSTYSRSISGASSHGSLRNVALDGRNMGRATAVEQSWSRSMAKGSDVDTDAEQASIRDRDIDDAQELQTRLSKVHKHGFSSPRAYSRSKSCEMASWRLNIDAEKGMLSPNTKSARRSS